MKEDVLSDLLPKILNDVICDLSPLQERLYTHFGGIKEGLVHAAVAEGEDTNVSSEDSGGRHVFQCLQYLRKLCTHPSLVFSVDHPLYDAVLSDLCQDKSSVKSGDKRKKGRFSTTQSPSSSFVNNIENAP